MKTLFIIVTVVFSIFYVNDNQQKYSYTFTSNSSMFVTVTEYVDNVENGTTGFNIGPGLTRTFTTTHYGTSTSSHNIKLFVTYDNVTYVYYFEDTGVKRTFIPIVVK